MIQTPYPQNPSSGITPRWEAPVASNLIHSYRYWEGWGPPGPYLLFPAWDVPRWHQRLEKNSELTIHFKARLISEPSPRLTHPPNTADGPLISYKPCSALGANTALLQPPPVLAPPKSFSLAAVEAGEI